jgi:hypothetical protein
MPHSTLYQCLGCRTSIAGEEFVTEFVERQVIDDREPLTVDALPQYTHEGHAEGGKARGYAPTGRVGVLNDLRDNWPPKRT